MTKNNQNPSVSTPDSDEIDLTRLFGLLLDKKLFIVAVTALFTLIGITYALLATPVYKADALIQIEQKNAGLPGLDELGEMFASDSEAVTEIELLKSRMVMGKVVDDLKLTNVVTPNYMGSNGAIGKFFARRYSKLEDNDFNQPWLASLTSEHYAWGGEVINVANFSVPRAFEGKGFVITYLGEDAYQLSLAGNPEKVILKGRLNQLATSDTLRAGEIRLLITDLLALKQTQFNLVKRPRSDAIKSLQANLSVSEKGKSSGILFLTLQGTDKSATELQLDAITHSYVLQNVQRMSAEVQNSIEFLEKELPQVKSQLEAAEALLNNFRLENQSVDLSLETKSILERIVELDTRVHELSFKETEIAQRYTKEHPTYTALISKKKDLLTQKQQLSEMVKNLPSTQQEILRLTRDVEVNQQIYLALLNNVQQLNVAKAGTVGNVRVVDQAQVGKLAVKPKKSLIVVLATMLGGMFAVAIVLLRAAFNRGITNPKDFEDIGLTLYATIPVSEVQDAFNKKRERVTKLKAKLRKYRGKKNESKIDPSTNRRKDHELLLAKEYPTDLAVEAIRSLRTSLHFAMLEAKNNVVMISGASPEVGKSFVSANLATVIAQSGKKVLIVDADMRRGYLQKMFDMAWDNGLSDHLSHKLELEKVIKSTGIENLDIVTRGEVPPNPSELLMSKRFEDFVQEVSKQYDLVLIDTPPIMAVTDPAVVGRHAGTSFMLTRYDISTLKEIGAALERFELNGVEIKGVIFNAMEATASSYYSDYGYYQYQYGKLAD
ncbi:polysaccharide biosynthesis tyrosine autokinase [Thalassotalea mangrovi]|uniref:Polysaccharide biosynthesis tyrosine autokinase n=1 Tax=Thalassotalea mangrovi TaxID=2572245 RepID=A0A4U1B882_9GAMM|nr:polysaccharide biosynthesis tyrosine autokinase [Thalassotalea mangrovi]TKB46153.1 polysaccharide biosynthesis tyrosine autokinase [Thalassotalea mangrovi]